MRPKNNILFLLDEFAQFGYMKPIEDAITLVRGYKIQLWLFIQDLSQIRTVYKKWNSFIANVGVFQVFGTADYTTAEYISKQTGTATVQRKGRSESRRLQGGPKTIALSTSDAARPLLTPDEILNLPTNQQILFIQRSSHPVLIEKFNYLKSADMSQLADTNPFFDENN